MPPRRRRRRTASPWSPRRSPHADGTDYVMLQALPTVDPSDAQMGTIVDALRAGLPDGALVGGAPAENLDLQRR